MCISLVSPPCCNRIKLGGLLFNIMENKDNKIYSILMALILIALIFVMGLMLHKISELEDEVKSIDNIEKRIKCLEDKTTCIEDKLEDIKPNDDFVSF